MLVQLWRDSNARQRSQSHILKTSAEESPESTQDGQKSIQLSPLQKSVESVIKSLCHPSRLAARLFNPLYYYCSIISLSFKHYSS